MEKIKNLEKTQKTKNINLLLKIKLSSIFKEKKIKIKNFKNLF